MVTPSSAISNASGCSGGRKRPRRPDNARDVEASASPNLDEGKRITMRRTPQPTFTQSKLTSLMTTSKKAPTPSSDGSLGSTAAGVVSENERMDTTQSVACIDLAGAPSGSGAVASLPAPASGSATPVTKDILMSALKENTDFIIKSFASSLGALSQRVESNTNLIARNATGVDKHEGQLKEHRSDIDILTVKVRDLERNAGARRPCPPAHVRAQLSQEFLRARRSLRLWPVDGQSEEDMWGGVGEFIHDILRVSTEEVGQSDIEDVRRVANIAGMPETERREVLVTFYDKKKRDTVISNSTNLASFVDATGKPTAGVRLEIPKELDDTFRLLSRFGTRLRARHGAGTKRHIKFDDFSGSLYANIKLPGDTSWTRVTAEMARDDLHASLNEENSAAKRRLATKLIPGPRERLGMPAPGVAGPSRNGGCPTGNEPAGKRPRWSKPDRGGLT